jgi:hypothetical protein
MIALRYRLKDLKVQAAEESFKSGTNEFPAGSFVVQLNQKRHRCASAREVAQSNNGPHQRLRSLAGAQRGDA